MSSSPDINPYEILGVLKDATTAEIKSAHRKLVLKCHPDKIQDESLRSQAQDKFQKVQQAYELLSDETSRIKYDQKVRLAELKREMQARARASGSGLTNAREVRGGRVYEERVPAEERLSPEPPFFEDEGRYYEPPRPMARKTDEFGVRTRSRATEEKKKSKVPLSPSHATKESRSSTKATRAGRDKYRTKERKREATEKHAYESDLYFSDSDSVEEYEIPVTRPSERRRHREPKPRATESTRRDHPRYEDDFSEEDSKHVKLHNTAADYIRRSRETIPTLEPERRHRSSRSPLPYDSPEPEMSSRHPGRSKRPSREAVRPPTSHRSSLEDLDSRPRVPPMPTAQTFPGPKMPSPSRSSTHQSSRSAPSVRSQSRSKREFVRSETVNLMGVKMRGEKYDSGYGSTSPAPEILTGESSPKSSRHKTVPTTILVEPPNTAPPPLRSSKTYSPPRQERRPPVRSSTYAYAAEGKQDRLYGEVDMGGRFDKKNLRYAREIGPEGVTYIHPYPSIYDEYRQASAQRRQSAY